MKEYVAAKCRFIGWLALSAVMVLMTAEANAFCIYNYSSYPIVFKQSVDKYGYFLQGGMNKVIPANGKECCNWQNKECNPGGAKTSSVFFHHSVYNPANNQIHNYRCNEQWYALEFQAGGYAEIYNNPTSIWGLKCLTYPAN